MDREIRDVPIDSSTVLGVCGWVIRKLDLLSTKNANNGNEVLDAVFKATGELPKVLCVLSGSEL